MKHKRRLSLAAKQVDLFASSDGEPGALPTSVLNDLRKQEHLCDVTLVLENNCAVHAHRLVLSCHSEYFRVMFINQNFKESKQIEIQLKQVPSRLFQHVLDFIYTGKCRTLRSELFDLLKVANMLDFADLVKVCSSSVLQRISIYNCFDMLSGAEDVGVIGLKKQCVSYCLQHFSIAVVSSKAAFLGMDCNLLKELIAQDTLSAGEEFVFEAIIEWLRENNPPVHIQNELLAMVRYPLMEFSFLHKKILSDQNVLKEFPKLEELCLEAAKYFAMKHVGFNLYSLSNAKPPAPRLQQFHTLVSNRLLNGHKRAVSCFLKCDDKILSGSYDRTIKVWSDSWECEATLSCNEQVLCLHNFGEDVLSGTSDGAMILWNSSTWRRRLTISAHTDAVSCLLTCLGKVLSGSHDRSIKVWSSSWECERTLQHARAVTCLLQCDDRVLSGSYDKTIKVWSATDWTCEKTLQEHYSYITCLGICRDKVLSGSRDNTIRVWDPAKSFTCVRTLNGADAVSCFLNCGDKLLSSSIDNTFKVWNPFTWELERSITEERGDVCFGYLAHKWRKGREKNINCLVQYGNKVLSGGSDKTITVWSISTHNYHLSKLKPTIETPIPQEEQVLQ